MTSEIGAGNENKDGRLLSGDLESTKLQTLYDHYKDTFALTQTYQQSRDKFFYLILVVIAIVSFQLYSPAEGAEALNKLQTEYLKLGRPLDISFIFSLLWLGLLGLVLGYYQKVLQIDRWFDYILEVEREIRKQYSGNVFRRESDIYFYKYRSFTKWAKILYTRLFPALLFILAITKMYKLQAPPSWGQNKLELLLEPSLIWGEKKWWFLFMLDWFTSICIMLSIIFYVWVKNRKAIRTWLYNKRKYIPRRKRTFVKIKIKLSAEDHAALKTISGDTGKDIDILIVDRAKEIINDADKGKGKELEVSLPGDTHNQLDSVAISQDVTADRLVLDCAKDLLRTK